MNRSFLLPFLVLALAAPVGPVGPVAAEAYPLIRVLSHDDALFVQQQSELEYFRQVTEARTPQAAVLPGLDLFEYAPRPAEDLFSLNARLGLRYDTLATLNGATSKDSFARRSPILIPSQDGVFVDDPPRGELQEMMLSTRLSAGHAPLKLKVQRDGRLQAVSFFPDDSFSAVERAYFLRILYRNPIDKGHVTSMYGWRSDPFTGAREFHGGLDIGAPEGTPVHAARDGTVTDIGRTDEYGRYVVITHPGGYQTVYGHLSSINATIGEEVSTGFILGAVGHTGRATGPHLHFEVRTRAGTRDPLQLIRMSGR